MPVSTDVFMKGIVMNVSSVFSNSFGLFGGKPMVGAKSQEFVAKNEKNDAYELNISNEAKNAYKASAADTMSRAAGKDLIAAAMPQDLKDKIKTMEEELSRILLSHNINTSKPIDFAFENGRVVVKGEHPEKEKIERVLNENKDLVNSIQKTLDEAAAYARDLAGQKYKVALKDKDDDEKETEYEKELRLKMRLAAVNKQIAEVSGDFSLSGGGVSMSSIAVANGATF